jgi:anti-sigma B factor antagonist
VTALTVGTEWHAALPVARVGGEVDASNAPELGVRLRELVTNESSGLIVDLSDTEYLDSAGINLLFAIGDELVARQQRLQVVVPAASAIARMLAITGLDRVHAVRETVPEALAG